MGAAGLAWLLIEGLSIGTRGWNWGAFLLHGLQPGPQVFVKSPELIHLVFLRVSQINGCAHCIDLHTRDARTGGYFSFRMKCGPGQLVLQASFLVQLILVLLLVGAEETLRVLEHPRAKVIAAEGDGTDLRGTGLRAHWLPPVEGFGGEGGDGHGRHRACRGRW